MRKNFVGLLIGALLGIFATPALAAYNGSSVVADQGVPLIAPYPTIGYINATWFGADPTGVADSTAALTAFLNYGLANNMAMYVPSGRYRASCNSTLAITLQTSQSALIYGDSTGNRLATTTGTVIEFYTGGGTCIPITGQTGDGSSASLMIRGVTFHVSDATITEVLAATNQGNISLENVAFSCTGKVAYGFTARTTGAVAGARLNFNRVASQSCKSRIALLTSPSANIGVVNDTNGQSIDDEMGFQIGSAAANTQMQNIIIHNLFTVGSTYAVRSYDGVQGLQIDGYFEDGSTPTSTPLILLEGKSIIYSSVGIDNSFFQRELANAADCLVTVAQSDGLYIGNKNTYITTTAGSTRVSGPFFACSTMVGSTNSVIKLSGSTTGLVTYANSISNLDNTTTTYTSDFDSNDSIKSANATAGAATCNSKNCRINTENLTTVSGATYTLTLTNTYAQANSQCQITIFNGTNSTAGVQPFTCNAVAGTVTAVVQNNGSGALNGTLALIISVKQ